MHRNHLIHGVEYTVLDALREEGDADIVNSRVGIISSVAVLGERDRSIAQLGITIGPAAVRHEDLLTHALKFSDQPVATLETPGGGDFLSAGCAGTNTLSAEGGFREDAMPGASERDKMIARIALLMGVKALWATLALSQHQKTRPPGEQIESLVSVLGTATGRDFASMSKDKYVRGGVYVKSNSQQIFNLNGYLKNI